MLKTVFQLDIHIFLRYVIVKNIKISKTLAIFDSFCINNILIHVNLCIHINRLIISYPCLKYTFFINLASYKPIFDIEWELVGA